MTFNINTAEIVKYTNKLEKLHRSAMPIAVRGTLNDLAFEGRKQSIKIFRKEFVKRAPSFPTSHIIANKCSNTFNINKMVSESGVIKGKSKSGDNLIKQEQGGTFVNRDIPINPVRISGNPKALINKNLYKKIYAKKPNGRIYKSGESTIIKTDKALLRVMRGSIWKTLYIFNRTYAVEKKEFIGFGGKLAATKTIEVFTQRADKVFKKYMK